MFAPKNLILSFLFLLLRPPPGAAAGAPLYKKCSGTGSYTANSTYQSNLDLILSSLVANASGRGASGFSAGITGQPPDQVSGLALCRGDVTPSACSSCLGAGAADVLDLCPYDKDAVVWYDYCLIRYSNLLHFLNSSNDNSKPVIFVNPSKVMDNLHLFTKMVARLLNRTAAWAAYNTTRRFATSVANSTAEFPPIHGLAQCTPDTTAVGCWQCLRRLIGEMPSYFYGSKSGWILGVRCSVRYELASFSYEALTLRLAHLTVNATLPAPAPVEYPPPVFSAANQDANHQR